MRDFFEHTVYVALFLLLRGRWVSSEGVASGQVDACDNGSDVSVTVVLTLMKYRPVEHAASSRACLGSHRGETTY